MCDQMLLDFYRTMVKIRRFEQTAADLFAKNLLPGFLHLYVGEEAVAAGACAALEKTDYITSTHRGHGHLIAKGGDMKKMMAELFGKSTGYCNGKGGSLHISDMDIGILGANGIVGAGIPIAAGAAFSSKYQSNGRVSVCFFGDGAANRGTFHEALNVAAIFKLPVIFVCENNLYGISEDQRYCMAIEDIADRAAAYGFPGVIVDGNDVCAVYETISEAVKRARNGEGPTLVECKTWRQMGHYVGDPDNYRDPKEKEEWLKNDPIKNLEKLILEKGVAGTEDFEQIQQEILAELKEAIREAQAAPLPPEEDLMKNIFAQ